MFRNRDVVWEGAPLISLSVAKGSLWAVQEAALELYTQFNCCVVFLGKELKEKYYKGKHSHTAGQCTDLVQ